MYGSQILKHVTQDAECLAFVVNSAQYSYVLVFAFFLNLLVSTHASATKRKLSCSILSVTCPILSERQRSACEIRKHRRQYQGATDDATDDDATDDDVTDNDATDDDATDDDPTDAATDAGGIG